MKSLLRLTALLVMAAAMALAVVSPATAQTPGADPEQALNEIAPEATVYGRTYEADMSGTPDPASAMPVMAIVQAYQLSDAETAAEAFPHVEQLMKDELEPTIGTELTTEEVDDLGDQATMSTAEVDQNGITATIALLIVQQDDMIFLSASVGMNGPADGTATDFMTFMLDGEAGDTEAVEFVEDGTSTGGYFEVFPTAEDTDVLQGLMVSGDMYETTD